MWKWSDLKRILLRKAQRDTADLGAVMWPVVWPPMNPEYTPKNPHITVVIFNDINNPELGYTLEDVVDAVRETQYNTMVYNWVTGVEWFGENQSVPVLRVDNRFLYNYRDEVESVLNRRGIPIDRTFPDYKPHVTITDAAALDGVYPMRLMAGPVEVWWGKAHYRLNDDGTIRQVLDERSQ